ncbi:hypothetical protein BB561_002765 [Smittium simulii]|uniref:Uncharacterized protein n=1 Tax=Smittium simulii TaxID=133385 RepID=A0A2T9YPA5_9FUNG|nr:hypothetical protein BB561_002765 [Smittium simulii]
MQPSNSKEVNCTVSQASSNTQTLKTTNSSIPKSDLLRNRFSKKDFLHSEISEFISQFGTTPSEKFENAFSFIYDYHKTKASKNLTSQDVKPSLSPSHSPDNSCITLNNPKDLDLPLSKKPRNSTHSQPLSLTPCTKPSLNDSLDSTIFSSCSSNSLIEPSHKNFNSFTPANTDYSTVISKNTFSESPLTKNNLDSSSFAFFKLFEISDIKISLKQMMTPLPPRVELLTPNMLKNTSISSQKFALSAKNPTKKDFSIKINFSSDFSDKISRFFDQNRSILSPQALKYDISSNSNISDLDSITDLFFDIEPISKLSSKRKTSDSQAAKQSSKNTTLKNTNSQDKVLGSVRSTILDSTDTDQTDDNYGKKSSVKVSYSQYKNTKFKTDLQTTKKAYMDSDVQKSTHLSTVSSNCSDTLYNDNIISNRTFASDSKLVKTTSNSDNLLKYNSSTAVSSRNNDKKYSNNLDTSLSSTVSKLVPNEKNVNSISSRNYSVKTPTRGTDLINNATSNHVNRGKPLTNNVEFIKNLSADFGNLMVMNNERKYFSSEKIDLIQIQFRDYNSLARRYKYQADKFFEKNKLLSLMFYFEACNFFAEGFWYAQLFSPLFKTLENWAILIQFCKFVNTGCESLTGAIISDIRALNCIVLANVNYQASKICTEIAKNIADIIKNDSNNESHTESNLGFDTGDMRSSTKLTFSKYQKLIHLQNEYQLESEHWYNMDNLAELLHPAHLSLKFPDLWKRCLLKNKTDKNIKKTTFIDEKLNTKDNTNKNANSKTRDLLERKYAIRNSNANSNIDLSNKSNSDSNKIDNSPLDSPLLYPISSQTNILDVIAFTRTALKEIILSNNISEFRYL